MGRYALDMEKYADLARTASAEGCVLLKNDNSTLPLKKGDKVAVFGRMAFHYYKSGLGSGGLVNTRYVVGILDALRACKDIALDEELIGIYEKWIKDHPYDEGEGWGLVPWSQEEMPVTEEMLQTASGDDVALVILGRTAGEDQDNTDKPGSYKLTRTEEDLIRKVSSQFSRTAVILNVGNIIDMKWVREFDPAAVLYAWQGGQEGGNGVCDVLMGRVNPCGKLTDTIAEDISDYPSTSNFGDLQKNYYKEDIYVGYRYFETFAKDKVLYPFGFGLSYTSFSVQASAEEKDEHTVCVKATVKNTGTKPGKEVLEVYAKAPQGVLDTPVRVLCGFAKTKELAAGEEEHITLEIPKNTFASYDDSGVTGHRDCFVLLEGTYTIYVGTDVRTAQKAGSYPQTFTVLEQLEEVCAPQKPFARMTRKLGDVIGYSDTPERIYGPYDRVEKPAEISQTGDKGYRLEDVYDKKISMETFVAQLSDEDLIMLFRGEGMCSPKVTPGTAAAFAGLTPSLRQFRIPAECASDGPSGIRMDCGTKAFSLPNGTLLGCTFNCELVRQLYEMTGLELRLNRVDTLLGPGLNIHRNPLNGRNFEYISEDPFLTGKMGAAQLQGLNIAGSTGTIKHFAANNQETKRHEADSIISVRALREIYLKGFEIAVKEGPARSVMTTYGPVNGVWTAGSYDLNTIVLRKDWGFSGIVMTDWWAKANHEGQPSDPRIHAVMAAAQNDVYMVTADAQDMQQDDMLEEFQKGNLTRGQLQRNAINILQFVLKSPAMLYEMDRISPEELKDRKNAAKDDPDVSKMMKFVADEQGNIRISGDGWDTHQGKEILADLDMKAGSYELQMKVKSNLDDLAQLPVTVYLDNIIKGTLSFRGSKGQWVTQQIRFDTFEGHHYMKVYFGATGLTVDHIAFQLSGGADKEQ